jgi:predicted nuclease of predicted toxin-antitoxin system
MASHDVRYAAETDHRAADRDLLALARAEDRIVITEDFDFGDLLVRDQARTAGVVILFLPKLLPEERAARLARLLGETTLKFAGALPVVEARRVRQRPLRLD